jgi:putative ABC transport system permease protein
VNGQDDNRAPMPASVLDQVKSTDGIANAEGGIFDFGGTVLTPQGKKIGPGRDHRLAPRRPALRAVRRGRGAAAVERRSGRDRQVDREPQAPQGRRPDPDRRPAAQAGVPDRRDHQDPGRRLARRRARGDADAAEAQRITGKVNQLDEIDATVQKGTDAQAVKRELTAKLGPAVHVRTGSEEAASQSKDIRDNLGFLQTALLAFAGISLFVGAFIIFNTFSITVAQRAREFGMLRTLGASRAQVLRSVLAEGLFLGFTGAVVGILLGIGLAAGLRALFKAIGFELPSNGTVIESRTIIVSIVVGVFVTMVATLAPAIRATRVPPVAALREGFVVSTGHRSRIAFPASIVMLLGGLTLMAVGLFGTGSSNRDLTFVGVGAGLMFLGTALLSPRLVPPIAGFIGAPMRGITGRLARENAMRQPGRTAATAAALMVGVALVAFAVDLRRERAQDDPRLRQQRLACASSSCRTPTGSRRSRRWRPSAWRRFPAWTRSRRCGSSRARSAARTWA